MRKISSLISSLVGISLVSCAKLSVIPPENSAVQPSEVTAPIGVSSMNASVDDCPNGGTQLLVFLDDNKDGGYQTSEILLSENNICNGQNGIDGSNGSNAEFIMGAVGPMVPSKNYSACHHDFLYIPDSQNVARGWLTFRHQANGSNDQGIGSTGFQTWNVDITHFSLGSEVGGVIYCNLNWDPLSKTLNYTVVDNTDGLAGLEGTLNF